MGVEIGFRFQVSSFRFQVSVFKFQVSSFRLKGFKLRLEFERFEIKSRTASGSQV
jgi:hypothetical protein